MDGRPKREASKVQDFRKYHLSGDIPSKGMVAATIKKLQSPNREVQSTGPGHTLTLTPGRIHTSPISAHLYKTNSMQYHEDIPCNH